MTSALQLFGPNDGSTSSRLERYARVQAIGRLCKDEENRLKDEFFEEASALESMTGGAYNVPVAGTGRVLQTDPQPKPYIDDNDAFGDWIEVNFPELTRRVQRVTMLDQGALAEAISTYNSVLDDLYDIDDAVEYTRQILAQLNLTETVVYPEDPFTLLEKKGYTLTRNGYVSEDGEKVPGVSAKTAKRNMTVTIDKTFKATLDAELRQSLLVSNTHQGENA